MTGAFLRAKRDGAFKPVEVEHLTKDERIEQFKDRSNEEILRWMDMLCEKIVETETLLNSLVEEGILKRGDDAT